MHVMRQPALRANLGCKCCLHVGELSNSSFLSSGKSMLLLYSVALRCRSCRCRLCPTANSKASILQPTDVING